MIHLIESPHEEINFSRVIIECEQTKTSLNTMVNGKDQSYSNVIVILLALSLSRKKLTLNTKWVIFDATLTSVEPKNIKEAITEPSWIDAQCKKIFMNLKRLKVWELRINHRMCTAKEGPLSGRKQAPRHGLLYNHAKACDYFASQPVLPIFHKHLSRIMSFITAQQTKLDLELAPKEKRLYIGKCNGRINHRKIQREPTFPVVLDALAFTPCYSAFLITTDVLKVYMHYAGILFTSMTLSIDSR
ncbi:hypothetical protein Tco_0205914 [Tanacetum coccineum]